MSRLDHPAVRRVQLALRDAGSPAIVVELAETARSAAEAALSLGVEQGAIVKSLVFLLGGEAVMVLVAGDRRCREKALPSILDRAGPVQRADAAAVRRATGFAIGGVAPVGTALPLATVIDPGLGRYETVYAAAGHPFCVFATSLGELKMLTAGILADDVAG